MLHPESFELPSPSLPAGPCAVGFPTEALSLQVLSSPAPKPYPGSKGAAAGLHPNFAACQRVPPQYLVPWELLPVPPTADLCPQGCPFPTLTPSALQQTF